MCRAFLLGGGPGGRKACANDTRLTRSLRENCWSRGTGRSRDRFGASRARVGLVANRSTIRSDHNRARKARALADEGVLNLPASDLGAIGVKDRHVRHEEIGQPCVMLERRSGTRRQLDHAGSRLVIGDPSHASEVGRSRPVVNDWGLKRPRAGGHRERQRYQRRQAKLTKAHRRTLPAHSAVAQCPRMSPATGQGQLSRASATPPPSLLTRTDCGPQVLGARRRRSSSRLSRLLGRPSPLTAMIPGRTSVTMGDGLWS
ncbi:MAG: hypothetical protein QOC54_1732 [Baekduia sp.]|nr:hypothetical protein [Baekduia sp.]